MRYLTAFFLLSLLFVWGCSKPTSVEISKGSHVVYDYSEEKVADAKNASPPTASAEVSPDRQKFVDIYDQRHAKPVAKPAVVPKVAPVAPVVAPLQPPKAPAVPTSLAKPEDIEAAKKMITELKGSFSVGPNKGIIAVRLEAGSEQGEAAISVEQMQLVGKLLDLESITFEGSAFDDVSLAPLADLKKIKSISVSNSNITADSLELFAGFPELTQLELRRDLKLDNAALEILQKMPKLEKLSLLYNTFTNSGMAKVSKIETLRSVDVRGCPDVSDTGAKYLARLPLLEEVYFRGMITNTGVENLAVAPKLRFIEFQDCPDINAESAEAFLKMPALTELRIFRCKSFDDEALTRIAPIPFELLELRDLNLTNVGIASLQGKESLKSLELAELSGVDATGLIALLSTLKNIDSLNCFFIPFNDGVMEVVAENMPQLQKLTIRSVTMTDAGIDRLLKLKNLQSLDIRENKMFSPETLEKLANLTSLRRLNLAGTSLSARENEAVVRSLRAALPRCNITE